MTSMNSMSDFICNPSLLSTDPYSNCSLIPRRGWTVCSQQRPPCHTLGWGVNICTHASNVARATRAWYTYVGNETHNSRRTGTHVTVQFCMSWWPALSTYQRTQRSLLLCVRQPALRGSVTDTGQDNDSGCFCYSN